MQPSQLAELLLCLILVETQASRYHGRQLDYSVEHLLRLELLVR